MGVHSKVPPGHFCSKFASPAGIMKIALGLFVRFRAKSGALSGNSNPFTTRTATLILLDQLARGRFPRSGTRGGAPTL
jgi:hypothetical protein